MHCEAYAVFHITKQAMKIGFLLQKIKEMNCIQVMYRSSTLYFQYILLLHTIKQEKMGYSLFLAILKTCLFRFDSI
jgi:hypothetical protein